MKKADKTKGFEFNRPDIVMVCAFRYALGRSTYVTSMMADEIIINWDILEEFQKTQIKDDIRHAIKHNMAGMDCDVRSWKKILEL